MQSWVSLDDASGHQLAGEELARDYPEEMLRIRVYLKRSWVSLSSSGLVSINPPKFANL